MGITDLDHSEDKLVFNYNVSQQMVVSHLNNSNDVSATSFQEMSIDEQAEGETGAAVTVDQLADEPRTCGSRTHTWLQGDPPQPRTKLQKRFELTESGAQVEQQQRVEEEVDFTDEMEGQTDLRGQSWNTKQKWNVLKQI